MTNNHNHCVPDFDIQTDHDHEYPILSPSALPRPKKPSIADDDIMELLWHNGQVVVQSQNQRSLRKLPPVTNSHDASPAGPSMTREIRPLVENFNQHLFMHEGEMASWLHYPIDDDEPALDQSFGADFLYSPPTTANNSSFMQTLGHTSQLTELRPMSANPRPPIPPPRRPEQRTPNFAYFSRHNTRAAEPSVKAAARESTVVDSCDTEAAASRVSETVRSAAEGGAGVAAPSTSAGGGRSTMMYDLTMTSSPGGSSSCDEPVQVAAAEEDRKRKGREAEEWECQSEDVDFESEAKKQVCGSTSTKRSRAAEVHNLSERRRRDRINEKMKALQELIPRCNKSDKASMLDEAISYLKSLQLQVQMMSMGCGMVPMMFPGIQQYMPAMGMGVGMGMGMEMGMNRPVMPFPNMLPGSALPAATAAAAHLGPRFSMPPFHMPHVPAPDSSRMQAANQSDNNMVTSAGPPDPNQSRIPNFTDPYQQYLGPHQMQFQLIQNQAMNQPNVSKPSNNGGPANPENH